MEYDPDDELLDAYRIELTTLRQRAEAAEASRDTARGVANAFRDTIERATGNHDAVHGLMILCESHEKLQAAERRVAELEGAVRKDRADIEVLTDALLGWNNQFEAWKCGDHDTPMFEPVNLSDAMDVLHRRADEAKAAIDEAGGQHD